LSVWPLTTVVAARVECVLRGESEMCLRNLVNQ
jgi:hypothetical protein